MHIKLGFNNSLPKHTAKGIIHTHSDFSYDGNDSVEDIANFLKQRGYSFICLTEHDDDFDHNKMARYVSACKNASDENFQVVPGLEFRCNNRMHILGIGIEEYFLTKDPLDAIMNIKKQGGVAVIAHPRKYINNISKEILAAVDGIEIWNGPNDSRFIPHYKMLTYYKRIKKKYPHIKAFCGADIHSLKNFFELDMIIPRGSIKDVIKKSDARMQGKYMSLLTDKRLGFVSLVGLYITRGLLNLVKSLRDFAIKSGS